MSDRPAGELRSATLPEVLLDLYQRRDSGCLRLKRGRFEKTLYLRNGAVVFAASNDRDDRLIQSLLRRGKVPLPRLLKGLEVSLRTRQRLGEVLVEQGRLSPEDLVQSVQDQIRDIVCGAFQWVDGSWSYEKGAEAGAENVTLPSHALELILEGVRRIESWARVQEVVGGLNTEYRATRDAAAMAEMARLLPGERQILNFCEETRTLEEICDVVPLNDFVICKLVWGLLVVRALMKA